MTPIDARGRLRSLAILAAKIDDGLAAHRLSAYAVRIAERPAQRDEYLADLEALARQTPNATLAGVLREACDVLRDVPKP